jgi:DNA-binding NtrC family response regulator
VRAIVRRKRNKVRLLALMAVEMQDEVRRMLSAMDICPVFVSKAADLRQFIRGGDIYQVALIPAALPDLDWWTIWGELTLLNPKPAILVYAQTANFELWSGVLEAGGYDVLLEPFTDESLKDAVLRAAKNFEERDSDSSSE